MTHTLYSRSDWSIELPSIWSILPVITWFPIWQNYVKARVLKTLARTKLPVSAFNGWDINNGKIFSLDKYIEIWKEKQVQKFVAMLSLCHFSNFAPIPITSVLRNTFWALSVLSAVCRERISDESWDRTDRFRLLKKQVNKIFFPV